MTTAVAPKLIELKEEDVFSYKQQFRMAVTAANDYANRRTGHSPDADPLEMNRLRAEFLTTNLGEKYGGDRIGKLESESAKGLPGFAAAARALSKLATELYSSTMEKPSTEAPMEGFIKVIPKTPAPK